MAAKVAEIRENDAKCAELGWACMQLVPGVDAWPSRTDHDQLSKDSWRSIWQAEFHLDPIQC